MWKEQGNDDDDDDKKEDNIEEIGNDIDADEDWFRFSWE